MKKIILSLLLVGTFYACSNNEGTKVEATVKTEVSKKKKDNKKYYQKPERTPMSGLDLLVREVKGETPIVQWEGVKPTGTHVGNLTLLDKKLKVVNGELKAMKFSFDMNSITCTDITNPEYNAKLINHLRSEDFFNVENYPSAMFNSTEITKEGDTFLVKGDITIKGITQSIVVPVYLKQNDEMNMIVGGVEVDRTKFKIHYKSKSIFPDLGDKFISDNFTIKFAIPQKK